MSSRCGAVLARRPTRSRGDPEAASGGGRCASKWPPIPGAIVFLGRDALLVFFGDERPEAEAPGEQLEAPTFGHVGAHIGPRLEIPERHPESRVRRYPREFLREALLLRSRCRCSPVQVARACVLMVRAPRTRARVRARSNK